jgi:hypothetical protein
MIIDTLISWWALDDGLVRLDELGRVRDGERILVTCAMKLDVQL